MTDLDAFIRAMPKVELHLHIEGTLEPAMMVDLARRNGIDLPYSSVEEVRAAYSFDDLRSFLDLYYLGAGSLCREGDFYDLTHAYLDRMHGENVRHVEVFFDPQTHTARGVAFDTVINGIWKALRDAEDANGLTSRLIMCFLRDQPVDSAMETLDHGLRFKNRITAVGLDSAEMGHPPEMFQAVFERARDAGFRTVAHAGEEGPPDYIWQALDVLGVDRIDHGVRCLEDPDLIERLAADKVPLTVCPLSNVELHVVDSLADHPLKRLLRVGLAATINSDDPSYLGGYLTDNFLRSALALDLDRADVIRLVRNSVQAAFIGDRRRTEILAELGGMSGPEGP